MGRHDRNELALAICLTTIAGAVDAMGFLQLGHLFVSFMSGNSTQLAVAAGRGLWQESKTAGSLVAGFILGVMIGRLLSLKTGHNCRPIVLAIEALLLGTVAFASLPFPIAIGFMTVAMGLQNTIAHRVAGTNARLTYMTGTLVSFGEKLTNALLRIDSALAFMPDLCLWLGFIFGAATGTLVFNHLGIRALAIPCIGLAILSISMFFLTRVEAS